MAWSDQGFINQTRRGTCRVRDRSRVAGVHSRHRHGGRNGQLRIKLIRREDGLGGCSTRPSMREI